MFKFWRRRPPEGLKQIEPRETAARIQVYFRTTVGTFRADLHHVLAPKTCQNFIDLAEGSVDWEDAWTGELMKGRPFFDGLVFHRVIEGFMIQTGCPRGDGRGDPGYAFEDELTRKLRHDAPGVLSMANSGPHTNGSQFFVTLGPTRHLDGKHTIFGRISQGLDVVQKIGAVATDVNDRPVTTITLESVKVERH